MEIGGHHRQTQRPIVGGETERREEEEQEDEDEASNAVEVPPTPPSVTAVGAVDIYKHGAIRHSAMLVGVVAISPENAEEHGQKTAKDSIPKVCWEPFKELTTEKCTTAQGHGPWSVPVLGIEALTSRRAGEERTSTP